MQLRGKLGRLAMAGGAAALILAGAPGLASAAAAAGTGWSLTPAPPRAKVPGDALSAMSCSGSAMCMAVGSSNPVNSSPRPLAEVWNGTSWHAEQAADPPAGGVLDAVSCLSPTSCVAAGYSFSGTGSQTPLAEGWDGTSWTIQTVPARNGTSWAIQATPDPAGVASNLLGSVFCVTTSTCLAVGYSTTASGKQTPLAETYSG